MMNDAVDKDDVDFGNDDNADDDDIVAHHDDADAFFLFSPHLLVVDLYERPPRHLDLLPVLDDLQVRDAPPDDVLPAHLAEGLLQLVARRPVAGHVDPQPQHDHGLLALVVRVLGPDDVGVRVVQPELAGRGGPVRAQQVADVRDPQVGPVEGVELAVAGLAEELVLAVRLRGAWKGEGEGERGGKNTGCAAKKVLLQCVPQKSGTFVTHMNEFAILVRA